MNKRRIWVIAGAILLTAILASSISTITVLAWPFGDVNPADWFYNDVYWLDTNNVTHGCGGGNYCPNNFVTRAEMAAFLHREAGVLVSAGVYVQNSGGTLSIVDWFNNYNGVAPVLYQEATFVDFDMGFSVNNRFFQCTLHGSDPDTRDAFCSAYDTGGNWARVRIYDVSVGGFAPATFWVLVYGQ